MTIDPVQAADTRVDTTDVWAEPLGVALASCGSIHHRLP